MLFDKGYIFKSVHTQFPALRIIPSTKLKIVQQRNVQSFQLILQPRTKIS